MSDATMWKGTTGSCPYSCPKCARARASRRVFFAHSRPSSRALRARTGSLSSRTSASVRAGGRGAVSRRSGARAAARARARPPACSSRSARSSRAALAAPVLPTWAHGRGRTAARM
eukprot:3415214-Prymnesium_polylepis.1